MPTRKTRTNRRTRTRGAGGLISKAVVASAAGIAMTNPQVSPDHVGYSVSQAVAPVGPYTTALNRLALTPNAPSFPVAAPSPNSISHAPRPNTTVRANVPQRPRFVIKCGVSRKTCLQRHKKLVGYYLNHNPGLVRNDIIFR